MPKRKATPKRATVKATPTKISAATRLTGKVRIGEIDVPYHAKCDRYRRRKAVHRRKQIPALQFGEVIGDDAPTPRLALATRAPARAAAAAKPPVQFHLNTQINDVATADTASHVCEPSVAANGNVIFATGNWFACVSTDGGSTFKYVDPYKSFPDPQGSKFCCDQVVVFSDSSTASSGFSNIERTATEKTSSASPMRAPPMFLRGIGRTLILVPSRLA